MNTSFFHFSVPSSFGIVVSRISFLHILLTPASSSFRSQTDSTQLIDIMKNTFKELDNLPENANCRNDNAGIGQFMEMGIDPTLKTGIFHTSRRLLSQKYVIVM